MNAGSYGYTFNPFAAFDPNAQNFWPGAQQQPVFSQNWNQPSPTMSPAMTTQDQQSDSPAFVRKVSSAPKTPRAKTARMQPSEKSGGVPEPSPEYLAQASWPPLKLPFPRQILVVIDLNGTLLYRPDRKQSARFIERPHARAFLSYCVNTFKVVIWSSAKPENVRNMCKQLLSPEDYEKVIAFWSRDHFGLTPSDYNSKVQCYKRLTKLWNDPEIAKSHLDAARGLKWSQRDTVLVDDSLEKGRSEPYNIIEIPEFFGAHDEPNYILPQVHNYLNQCSQEADISTFIRETRFQMDPNFTL
ncbi:hypothetical protein F4780DRAFT_780312 [Xylariomycetidae sp. FL0641]|nr:hypothetical protein F4780DRAFT_780312 [Xylariomycetidae sp. FL0641]